MSRVNPELLRSALVAALGSFLFGFDTAVISGTTEALRLRFALTNNQLGLTVASALVGTILGSLAAGSPAERRGRRPVLRGLAVLYLVSAAGCALAWDWWSLVGFRLIGGLAIGGSSVVAPLYGSSASASSTWWRGSWSPTCRTTSSPRASGARSQRRGG